MRKYQLTYVDTCGKPHSDHPDIQPKLNSGWEPFQIDCAGTDLAAAAYYRLWLRRLVDEPED